MGDIAASAPGRLELESHLGEHIGRKGIGRVDPKGGLFEEGASEELTVGVMVLGFWSDRDEVIGVAEDVEVGAIGDSAMGEDERVALIEVSPVVELVNELWGDTGSYFSC